MGMDIFFHEGVYLLAVPHGASAERRKPPARIVNMQEFILGLVMECEECSPGSCWWDPSIGTCTDFETCVQRHDFPDGMLVAQCGACGQQTGEWQPHTIFDYCGARPFVWCPQCRGSFILCVNTNGHYDDLEPLCRDSCCRVLTQADQHRIPNFEQVVFRDGKANPIMFIACHALAITHLSPMQFDRCRWLVPKSAAELAAKTAQEDTDELVELSQPVYNYGGQDYPMDYRGACPHCDREVQCSVSAD